MARTYHRDKLGRFAPKGFSGQSSGRGARLTGRGARSEGGAKIRGERRGGFIAKPKGLKPGAIKPKAAPAPTKAKPTAGNAPKRLAFQNFYHGTSAKAGKAIRKGGYRESKDGLLGPGVYAGRKRHVAEAYARKSSDGGDVIKHRLLKSKVDTRRTNVMEYGGILPQLRAAAQQARSSGRALKVIGDPQQSVLMGKAMADRSIVKAGSTIRAKQGFKKGTGALNRAKPKPKRTRRAARR